MIFKVGDKVRIGAFFVGGVDALTTPTISPIPVESINELKKFSADRKVFTIKYIHDTAYKTKIGLGLETHFYPEDLIYAGKKRILVKAVL